MKAPVRGFHHTDSIRLHGDGSKKKNEKETVSSHALLLPFLQTFFFSLFQTLQIQIGNGEERLRLIDEQWTYDTTVDLFLKAHCV